MWTRPWKDMSKNVLVPLDRSEQAKKAFEWALEEAQKEAGEELTPEESYEKVLEDTGLPLAVRQESGGKRRRSFVRPHTGQAIAGHSRVRRGTRRGPHRHRQPRKNRSIARPPGERRGESHTPFACPGHCSQIATLPGLLNGVSRAALDRHFPEFVLRCPRTRTRP